MNQNSKVIKITLCGPSDVGKEIKIAREVIDKWNQLNWESTGWGLKVHHWDTDAIPTMAERGQAVINHQLIDESDLIVAIFWSRLGTPTGMADSGTAEEITRAMAREIRVLVYFSNLEAPGTRHDANQAEKLAAFRSRIMNTGLPSEFKSRKEFRDLFTSHLDRAVRQLLLESSKKEGGKPKRTAQKIIQRATGNTNVQIAGDGNTLHFKGASKRPKVTIERSPDHISPADQKRVSDWIKELAEESTGKELAGLISEWWNRLYNRFNLVSYKELKSGDMPAVEAWHQQQLNLIRAKRKANSPDAWRKSKYAAIKSKMRQMRRTEDEYYPELSDRLNMKKPFKSLKNLSKHDLGRVDSMVRRDYDKWKK